MTTVSLGIIGLAAVGFGALAMMAQPAASAPAATTIVYVVRHAEKIDNSADAALSPAGIERARLLARVLADVPLAAVYHTKYARSRETGRPTAQARGVPLIEINQRAELAAQLRATPAGKSALVVGHSNTVPEILAALGATGDFPVEESEFDNLFVVVLGPVVHVHRLHYGSSP
jgi:phosphohistidine phosphatase SixA